MLLFIRLQACGVHRYAYISIHLMLLFIINDADGAAERMSFQYISCYCLSRIFIELYTIFQSFQYISCYCLSLLRDCRSCIRIQISIHLMLLFIASGKGLGDEDYEFQYISCYCLSLPGRIVSVLTMDFNTSHVTVYQALQIKKSMFSVFQYISCYCLSECLGRKHGINQISIHLMLLFIDVGQERMDILRYFNTSHVTVYQPC